MGCATYIGRIGILAVALGVGGAVCAPQTAWADDTAQVSSAATKSEQDSSDGPHPTGATASDSEVDDTTGAPQSDVGIDPSSNEESDEDPEFDDDTPLTSEPDTAPTGLDGTDRAERLDITTATPGRGNAAHRAAASTTRSPASAGRTDVTHQDPGAATHAARMLTAVDTEPEVSGSVSTALPSSGVTVTVLDPAPRPVPPLRAAVLQFLGLFGFNPNPAPGGTNNPLLEAVWASYRRIESYFDNERPTIGAAHVLSTSLTGDGKVAVLIDVEISDYDGDPLTLSTTGGSHGTFTRNADGTFTYLTDADRTGTDSVVVTATDTGAHLHGLARLFTGGGHTTRATLEISVTATEPTDGAPVIDSVVSAPQTGNTWTITVNTSDPDDDPVTVLLTADEPDHVSVTALGGSQFVVTVTDADWARAHPGYQVRVTATASDDESSSAPTTLAIGTVSNAVQVGSGVTAYPPALPAGLTYTQSVSTHEHSVLLRSDGSVVTVGSNFYGETNIPPLPTGLTYTQIAAANHHTVLLRSDGAVFGIGNNDYGQTTIPTLPTDVTYTGVATGYFHTVLLRSDGTAISTGLNTSGQGDIPAPPPGATYTGVAAGSYHTVLLRSNGTAISIGQNLYGENNIPGLPGGVTYIQVTANANTTVLLRSDGIALAVGEGVNGLTDIPTPPAGTRYTRILAGIQNTVLLRSDGAAISIGDNTYHQTELPALPVGVDYVGGGPGEFDVIMLVSSAD